jgi:hypothetical protein
LPHRPIRKTRNTPGRLYIAATRTKLLKFPHCTLLALHAW